MTIAPVRKPENALPARRPRRTGPVALALVAASALAVCAVGCSSLANLSEIAADEPGTFGPSERRVRNELADDRVRDALDTANQLRQTYRGPLVDLLLGWSRYRNGWTADAERAFRRATMAGLREGAAGLAYIHASHGDWQRVADSLETATGEGFTTAEAFAMRASDSWRRGESADAADALRSWSLLEPDERRRSSLEALARAVRAVTGSPHQWSGRPSLLELDVAPGGELFVEASIEGLPARLAIDLVRGRSRISPQLAEDAGLIVLGRVPAGSPAEDPAGPDSPLTSAHAVADALQLGETRVEGVVFGVGAVPSGTDGTLAADLLLHGRWSVWPAGRRLAVGPPEAGRQVELSITPEGSRTLAWLDARTYFNGLAIQLVFSARIDGGSLPAFIDTGVQSLLDPRSIAERDAATAGAGGAGAEPTVETELRLGGWSGTASWHLLELQPLAVDGSVATYAVIARDRIGEWVMHWVPETTQIRLQVPEPALAATPHSDAGAVDESGRVDGRVPRRYEPRRRR